MQVEGVVDCKLSNRAGNEPSDMSSIERDAEVRAEAAAEVRAGLQQPSLAGWYAYFRTDFDEATSTASPTPEAADSEAVEDVVAEDVLAEDDVAAEDLDEAEEA